MGLSIVFSTFCNFFPRRVLPFNTSHFLLNFRRSKVELAFHLFAVPLLLTSLIPSTVLASPWLFSFLVNIRSLFYLSFRLSLLFFSFLLPGLLVCFVSGPFPSTFHLPHAVPAPFHFMLFQFDYCLSVWGLFLRPHGQSPLFLPDSSLFFPGILAAFVHGPLIPPNLSFSVLCL